MSTLCSAISVMPIRRSLSALALAAATMFAAGDGAAQDEKPPPPPDLRFGVGGWGGDGLVNARRGRFLACGAAARFAPDVTIEFALDRLEDLTMQISSPRWRAGGGGYEVHVGADKALRARAVRTNKLSFSFGNDDDMIAPLFTSEWIAAVLPDGYTQYYLGDGRALLNALRACVRKGMAWEASAYRSTAPLAAAPTRHWCAAPSAQAMIPDFAGAPLPGGPAIAERAGLAALFQSAAIDPPAPTPDNLRRRNFPDARRAWVSGQTFGALQLAEPGARPLSAFTVEDVSLDAFDCADGDVDLLLRSERALGDVARFTLTCRAPTATTRFVTLFGDSERIAMLHHCAEPERFDQPFAIDEALGAAVLRGLSGWGR